MKCLINGTSIAQISVDAVTCYHAGLPSHSVLLADCLPTENCLDVDDRMNFANCDGPVCLRPDFLCRVWEAEGCAPLVVTGPKFNAAQRWLNEMAGFLPGIKSASRRTRKPARAA